MRHLERHMYTAFGSMIALMIVIVLLSAGTYFRYALSMAQEDLSTVLTRILADSVSRISFSGKYHTRLLLEDIKQQQPELSYLLVADKEGQIIAHSDAAFNDRRLDAASLKEADKVLRGSPRAIRILQQNGMTIREVTLPYRTGFDYHLAGVIQVGLCDQKLFSDVRHGGWFALVLGILLLSIGLSIGFIYINHQFVLPVRLMASQLEGIMDNAPTLIAIRNRDGLLVSCSKAFRDFFGLQPDQQNISNAQIYTTDAVTIMNSMITTIKDTRSSQVFELTIPDQSGDLRTFLVNGFPILSDEAEVQLIGSFSVDLTELRKTELALRQSLAEVKRASEAKSEFLSRMSHELRTPLNAIIGFSQVLQSDPTEPLSEEQQDNVEEILRAGRHLLELINEILDLARIESGHLAISLEKVSILKMFEECSSLVIPLAAQRGIAVDYINCCPVGDSCQLLCDPLRTRQVLLNLLSNAIKYNRDNGTVSMACSQVAEGFCRVTVKDTGYGIDAEFLPLLFEPFERAVPDRGGIEGSGIGLALTKRLVEAMSGRIGVDTIPGQGSSFWFELPSVGRTEESSQDDSLTPTQPALPDTDSSRYTILSIEDNPANQRLIAKILAARPAVTLLEVASAEDCLELVRNCRVDLVLMDINLPGMDGYEGLAQLRSAEDTARIPVVAISINALPGETERALAAGFAAYFTKPVDVARLLEQIDTLMHTSREEQTR